MFIVFEGFDCSGKTTNIAHAEKFLREAGYDVVCLREPGGTPIGEQIRNLLLDGAKHQMTAKTELLLFMAARAQLIETVVVPALKAGKVVLMDRYIDSSYAYQGAGRGLWNEVFAIDDYVLNGPTPNYTFFFDVDFNVALERLKTLREASSDRFENEDLEFKRRVYAGYIKSCRRDKDWNEQFPDNQYPRIDANQKTEGVTSQVLTALYAIVNEMKGESNE